MAWHRPFVTANNNVFKIMKFTLTSSVWNFRRWIADVLHTKHHSGRERRRAVFAGYILTVTEPFMLIMMVLLSHSLRFPDIDGTQKDDPERKYKLSWNPCTQFSDGNCKNVLVSNIWVESQWPSCIQLMQTVECRLNAARQEAPSNDKWPSGNLGAAFVIQSRSSNGFVFGCPFSLTPW